ncbi:MAG TPA: hypothetical protein VFO10_28725 [Oligoflexus sp.]|uniref:hypothetical protein n=1 Tax=Oligoflexus sp. TaxID=1971216 RepID=UPI002D7F87A0|nr:hypothetical protein [Oligoflexus sp.]HET9241284.1 hypothetical protein [Oligoflexus sp.]
MLYRASALIKIGVQAVDRGAGIIKDLYFDDRAWKIRYCVVDTGSWLSGRQVLISPEALTALDAEAGAFQSKLTEEQIKNSPGADTEKTVSRQYEEYLSSYYGWSPYWSTPQAVSSFPGIYTYPPYPAGISRTLDLLSSATPKSPSEEGQSYPGQAEESHLRSFLEVKSYGLRALDGDLGHVEDLLIDAADWSVTHVIVDTRTWWPGGEVVVDRGMIQAINWEDRVMMVAMVRDEVKEAPPYSRDLSLSESFQTKVSQYYQDLSARRHSVAAQTRGWSSQGESPRY